MDFSVSAKLVHLVQSKTCSMSVAYAISIILKYSLFYYRISIY